MTDTETAGVSLMTCDHHWVAEHKPGHKIYWVRQCDLCHAVDWDSLDGEVAVAEPRSLAEALAQLQTALPRIGKDKTAKVVTKEKGTYTYDYANLATISAAVLPLMGPLGLSFTAAPTLVSDLFMLEYALRHVGGEQVTGLYPLPDPTRTTPQQVGSAITYARRYCLCAVTGVAPDDDDDDGQAAAQARTAAPKGRRQPPPERAPDALPRNRDGGISRSQATDDELHAAGNMTDAQLREHNRLEREVKGTGPQGTTRLTATPDDDPWQLPAPAPARPIDSRIVRHFERFGITDKDVRLGYTATLAGRDDAITTTKDLTVEQAVSVLTKLASCKDRAAFDELMGASP